MQFLLSKEVRQAVEDGSYEAAFEEARGVAELELARGLEAVMATAETNLVLYDALAARWIVAAFEERRFPLHYLGWGAMRFQENLEPGRYTAEALEGLLKRKDNNPKTS